VAVSAGEWASLKQELLDSCVVPAGHHQRVAPPQVHTNNYISLPPSLPAGQETYSSFDMAAAKEAGQESAQTEGELKDHTILAVEGKSVDLKGQIDVVFLPDMDEQYAVHNRNWLAKSTYGLNFKDGWQLVSVNGEFDSTTVAIEVLNTVDAAVNAAKRVGIAGIGGAGGASPAGAASREVDAAKLRMDNKKYVFVEVVRQTYLKPGFYRINKPWEVSHPEELVGAGLLAKMGLETVTVTTIRPATLESPPATQSSFP
jgi:hypothetical protein